MKEVREELCRVVRELSVQGWCQGTGGNFSARIANDPLQLLITRSSVDKRHLVPDDLVVVDTHGKAIAGLPCRPSAEAVLHATVAQMSDAGAVLHTRSVWATLLGERFANQSGITLHGYEMLKGLEGIKTHEAEVFVPIIDNSQDMKLMATRVQELFAEWPALLGFLVAGHGLYSRGATLAQAQRHVEIFEFLFECVGRRTRFAEFSG